MKAGSALLAGAALADPPNMDIVVAEVAAVGVGATLWKVDGPTTSAAEPKKDEDAANAALPRVAHPLKTLETTQSEMPEPIP